MHWPGAQSSPIRDIVGSYSDPLIKTYSRIRFTIMRHPLLQELDQWLPSEGRILDLGSGFGLFSQYFASTGPARNIVGVELNEKRVRAAETSAARLGLSNVEYHPGDVLEWVSAGSFDGIYMIDVLHHLPRAEAPAFLERLVRLLSPGGVLLLKEVADRPRYKMLFTLALDRLMVGFDEIHYWSPEVLAAMLRDLGLDVKRHRMNDVLPYPHILYICRKADG